MLLAAVCALAGCGSSSSASSNGVLRQTPAIVLSRARAVTSSALSVRVSGYDDQLPGRLEATDTPSGSEGQIPTSGGQPLRFVRLGGVVYQEQPGGSWARSGIDSWDVAPDFGPLTDSRSLSGWIFKTATSARRGLVTEVGGQQALELDLPTGEVIYVATHGPPYVLQATGPGFSLSFGAWGQAASVRPPG